MKWTLLAGFTLCLIAFSYGIAGVIVLFSLGITELAAMSGVMVALGASGMFFLGNAVLEERRR